jgi:hypothetical protein
LTRLRKRSGADGWCLSLDNDRTRFGSPCEDDDDVIIDILSGWKLLSGVLG